MFGRKRIAELESDIVQLESMSNLWETAYDGVTCENNRLAISNEKQAREIEHTNRKLVLAERAAKTVIDANEELVRLHAKDWLEIRELKADIAKQVREIERLKATHQDHEPASTEEPQRGYGPEYLNLQRKVKRLRAKVKKLTSDNKAMAAEIMRNSMQ